MKQKMIQDSGKLIVLLIFISGIVLFASYKKDLCLDLDPCEQYKCLNPQFYCAKILYKSNIQPVSMNDAEKIVMGYIETKLELTAKIILSSKTRDPYRWYQISCRFSNGSEYGYEVGPDGNIYEIKHLN